MAELNSFLTRIKKLCAQEDGPGLSRLLMLPIASAISAATRDLAQRAGELNVQAYCATNLRLDLEVDITSVVGYYLSALSAFLKGDYATAVEQHTCTHKAILMCFVELSWFGNVLVRCSEDLRLIAKLADEKSGKGDDEFLRKVDQPLKNGFTAAMKDKRPITEPGHRKLFVFGIVNVIFKANFSMNQPIQCNSIVKHTETLGDLRMFPISDIVTYKFYVGRLKMFEDRYDEARAALRVALKYTPLSARQNRLRILATLIPVEMIHGIMPSAVVADTYGFHEYFALAQATIYGNLRDFEAIMQQNQRSFIRLGVYLVLEQIKVIAYRNLYRRVYTVTNNTRLRLPIFEAVMNWLGDEATLDEVECIVSNLIVQGKVKGYINHEKWTLVLSKMEPFPKRAVVKQCERISL